MPTLYPIFLGHSALTIKKGINVSKKTLYNRNKFLFTQMEISTVGSSNSFVKQASKLVKTFPETDRKQILRQVDFPSPQISAEATISMKVDIGIPWENLKKMGRYKVMCIIQFYKPLFFRSNV